MKSYKSYMVQKRNWFQLEFILTDVKQVVAREQNSKNDHLTTIQIT